MVVKKNLKKKSWRFFSGNVDLQAHAKVGSRVTHTNERAKDILLLSRVDVEP